MQETVRSKIAGMHLEVSSQLLDDFLFNSLRHGKQQWNHWVDPYFAGEIPGSTSHFA